MTCAIAFTLLLAGTLCFFAPRTGAQGETTSAILGQVADASGAAIPGATVSITSRETGMRPYTICVPATLSCT
jgi:hypothetical protein